MLLNKILLWLLNSPTLLALQDFLATPVLKRLPSKRYEKIRFKKNILFKIFGFGASTLAIRHLARKDMDLSLRYACEIVSNQGYIFYSQNWKAYLLYVGLIHAYKKNYAQSSLWLAAGITKQKSRLHNLTMIQSYPDDFAQWRNNNIEVITTAEGWHSLLTEADKNEENRELLLIYIAVFVFSLQLKELVATFFDVSEIKHHSDWKKMIVYRDRNLSSSKYSEELSNEEIWHGSYSDTSQKLAVNVLNLTFQTSQKKQTQLEDNISALSKTGDYPHVKHKLFPLIMKAFSMLNKKQYTEAVSLLKDTLTSNADIINSVKASAGPTKIFLAGFGWSGSSAVHDALRCYPHTKDMPGVGNLPFLNIGADSEPMLHQGPGSLHDLVSELNENQYIQGKILKCFFKNYVLLMPSYTYKEYKAVHANKNIIDVIGFDNFYLLICEFIYQYASALHKGTLTQALSAIESFQENIVNMMFDDTDIVFFNNSIFAHRAKILNNIRGQSYYIVVNRKMSDQFCDQMRSNKFFNARFLEFYLVKLSRVIAYKLAKRYSTNKGVEFIDIMFESWIKDQNLREAIAIKICKKYDKSVESTYFDPDKSARNINIPRDQLGKFDKTCLNIFEYLGLSI
ncbi:hypothetical protein SAMN02745866_00229 [Alteromonadaceae bacterium Bs31]|nr:hypothetical protein SAMN02745866_00229 [Alteromonadaceae bacterium Bs31]